VGLRTSWLSREIFAFGAFAGCATLYAAAVWLLPGHAWLPVLAGAVVVTGLAGVGCSIMIYSVIRRAYWSIASTSLRFLGTTALLGLAVIINVVLLTSGDPRGLLQSYAGTLLQALALVTIGKLVIEAAPLRSLRDRQQTPLKRTALLMTGALWPVVQWRYAIGLLGGVLCPLLMLAEASSGGSPQSLATVVAPIALVACLVGELFERYLFFTAVVANRMPGGMRA
jgi:DMSO reductase anchor subunit